MRLDTIHHVAIIASDYARSRSFYVEKLGFEVIRENARPERGDYKLDLRINETTELELFGMPNPPARVSGPEACGLRHLAFRVRDVEKTFQNLLSCKMETLSLLTLPKIPQWENVLKLRGFLIQMLLRDSILSRADLVINMLRVISDIS